MNTHVHLVVPDLFLPQDIAAKVCNGLQLSALERILSRASATPLQPVSLEQWSCDSFGVAAGAVAPVTLQADGDEPGPYYWLRTDPVHLQLMHDQLILQPAAVSAEEAAQFCHALNEHFAADGLHFIAPHPQHWYLRLDAEPQIATAPLSLVAGRNIRHFLPQGEQALRWHGVLNEIQMLLHAHPLNELREQRGKVEINGLWLWGGGHAGHALLRPFDSVYSDSELVMAFAVAAGIKTVAVAQSGIGSGSALIVWNGLHVALQHDDLGNWRDSLQRFELECMVPLLEALRSGRVGKITFDVLRQDGSQRFMLTRSDNRKFWRRVRPLASHAVV